MLAMVGSWVEGIRGRRLGRAPLAHAGPRQARKLRTCQGARATVRGIRRDELFRGCYLTHHRGAITRDAARRHPSEGPAYEHLQGRNARGTDEQNTIKRSS
jgi:hypothetical protein